jgi:hypothetical protein
MRKKKDIDDRVEELEEEQKKKDNAPKTTDEQKAEKLIGALEKTASEEPWDYAVEEATQAAQAYVKVHKGGKKVKPKDVRDQTEIRAQTYIMALWNLGGKERGPKHREFYGHMMRTWLGNDYSKLENAVKNGNETEAVYLMQQAYMAHLARAKYDTVLTRAKTAPTLVKEKMYEGLAKRLGGPDGDVYKVIESLPEAFQGLQEKRRLLKDYRKE